MCPKARQSTGEMLRHDTTTMPSHRQRKLTTFSLSSSSSSSSYHYYYYSNCYYYYYYYYQVVDTTGAGDAFCAGFLWYYVKHTRHDPTITSLQSALRYGCIAGTAVVTKMGASTTPTTQEITAITKATHCGLCLV